MGETYLHQVIAVLKSVKPIPFGNAHRPFTLSSQGPVSQGQLEVLCHLWHRTRRVPSGDFVGSVAHGGIQVGTLTFLFVSSFTLPLSFLLELVYMIFQYLTLKRHLKILLYLQ